MIFSWDLAPKPGSAGQAVLPAGVLQFAQAGNVQFVNQHPGLLGAQSRHPEQFQEPRRGLVPELPVEGRFPPGEQFADDPGQGFADALDVGQFTRAPGRVQVPREGEHRPGPGLIGPHLERVFPGQLQEESDLLQDGRHLFLIHSYQLSAVSYQQKPGLIQIGALTLT